MRPTDNQIMALLVAWLVLVAVATAIMVGGRIG